MMVSSTPFAIEQSLTSHGPLEIDLPVDLMVNEPEDDERESWRKQAMCNRADFNVIVI